jgi:hypothetical protein
MEPTQDIDEWFNQFRACMQDMGCSAYHEARVLLMFKAGYSPAEAAGEEACEEDC